MSRLFIAILLAILGAGLATVSLAKPMSDVVTPAPDPNVIRQGGDTFATALLLGAFPVEVTGTTAGYTDDYDEVCPFDNGQAPDVVYRFTVTAPTFITLDMFGSQYDTKVYVYGAGFELLACNDDYYADYTSLIMDLEVFPGVKYYVVVDGYGMSYGEYVLNVTAGTPGVDIECWDWSLPEDEPPLGGGYVDSYNGGCTDPDQGINILDLPDTGFCSTSGWFDDDRDHDWYRCFPIWDTYGLQVAVLAEEPTRLTAYVGADCGALVEVASVLAAPGEHVLLEAPLSTEDEVWLEVHPESPMPPGYFSGHEYEYNIYQEYPVAPTVTVEQTSWSELKARFD